MSKRKKSSPFPIKISVSPIAALIAALILGGSYIAVELFQKPPVLTQVQDSLGRCQPEVCFTPNKGCQDLILKTLKEARKSIHIQAYSFTDPEIGKVLQEASRHNISVNVILDKSNRTDKRSLGHSLAPFGIRIRYDYLPGIAHNKVIIVDQETIITGSYNFSKSAYSRNAENVLILKDKDLATLYFQNWQSRWEKSRE